jgi:hypothetical protein
VGCVACVVVREHPFICLFCRHISFVIITNEIGPDILIALIYPGAALNIVLLLVFGMRYWPALFFNPYVGTLLNEAFGQPHLPFFSVALFWYAVIQGIGSGGVCWIAQRLRLDARLVRTRDTILVLLLTSFVGPLAEATNKALSTSNRIQGYDITTDADTGIALEPPELRSQRPPT